MSDNIRTSLYGCRIRRPAGVAHQRGTHRRWLASSESIARVATSSSATPGCPTTSHPGDLLAVAATGAYCYSMSSRYNLIGRPAVVAVRDGRARLILRRETVDDLLSLEVR